MKFSDKLRNINFDFVRKSGIFIIIAVVILVVGLLCLFIRGVNLSIDFTGGTLVNMQIGEELDTSSGYKACVNKTQDVMDDFGLKIAYDYKEGSGSTATLQIRFQNKSGLTNEEMRTLTADLVGALRVEFPTATIEEGTSISATASKDLVRNAVLAVIIASIIIVVYLALRFKNLMYGICSIIGLLHDVLIVCAFMLVFNLEVGSSFIAVLITIIGYSINNNVVVFDRIRENEKLCAGMSVDEITNKSIKQSLTRTIFTTLTTIITITTLAIIGVPAISSFALPIIVGIVGGLYSTIFLVSPIWSMLTKKYKKIK